jgi:cell division transport system ATP-binding protein
MIQLFHVDKEYGRNHPALSDVSLSVGKREFAFVTGPSGAGKTSLIKLIFCAERPTRGQIIVQGVNLSKLKDSRIPYLRRKIGVVFQDFKLIPDKTAFQNVALACEILGASPKEIRKRVWQVLKVVGLHNKRDSLPRELSGGEQQRIAIARAIVNEPPLLLADEPTGNLDDTITLEIMDILKAINVRGATVLVATHNRDLAAQFGSMTICLDKGRRVDPMPA